MLRNAQEPRSSRSPSPKATHLPFACTRAPGFKCGAFSRWPSRRRQATKAGSTCGAHSPVTPVELRPDPSMERTSSRRLRLLSAAARVKRFATRMIRPQIFAVASVLALGAPGSSAQSASAAASSPQGGYACFNFAEVMRGVGFPRAAAAQNLREGFALVEFTLTIDGRVTDVRAVESSHPIFAASAESIVSRYQCRGIGREVQVRVPFRYSLSN